MKKIFALVLTSSMVLSCSDFFNAKKSKSDGGIIGGQKPTQPVSANPFPNDFDPNQGQFSEYNMVANVGLNVIAPAVRAFRLNLEVMNQDFVAACTATPADDLERLWQQAMVSYHFLKAMEVGPALDAGRVIADSIYSWPLGNMCGVDEEVFHYSKSGIINKQIMFTSKGLMAIEYLLMSPIGSVCSASNPRNKDLIEWSKSGTAVERRHERCVVAASMSDELLLWARSLETAWNPSGANFTKAMVDGTQFPRIKEAVNVLSDALFNLEKVKDVNLAKPIGQHKTCGESSGKCPESVEHLWSGISIEAIEAEVRGFSALYHGSRNPDQKAYGFDDYLVSVGQATLAAEFSTRLKDLLIKLEEVKKFGALQDQVNALDVNECKATTSEDRRVPVCALLRDLNSLMRKMKSDFLVLLSLRAPPHVSGEGDND